MDIRHFAKLYKLNIPVKEHAEYYFRELSRCSKHRVVIDLILPKFRKVEDTRRIHMQWFDAITEWYKKQEFYGWFNEWPIKDYGTVKIDRRGEMREGEEYVSFDIKNANHSVLQSFNPTPITWMGFFDKTVVDFGLSLENLMWLSGSKNFRQVVYGHLNCGRNVKIQHRITSWYYEQFPDWLQKRVIFLSPDEIIVPRHFEDVVRESLGKEPPFPTMDFEHIIYESKRFSIRRHESYPGEVIEVRDYHGVSGYSELFGVEGNRFWVHYHKYILGEDNQDYRNFLFQIKGRTAAWQINNSQ